ncbi:MAG: H-X9-DG-CTERM domain-containing protein [Armatimonadota bacterium]|nr:H-X9-DG-CTERM domain-containing protein [Armatimonadota bacterium]
MSEEGPHREQQQPPSRGAPEAPTPLALAAAVLGILALVIIPLALIALPLGIIALVRGHAGREMAIIGVVAAVLALTLVPLLVFGVAPVFLRSHQKARQTTCASNVKQISLAQLMYAADYNDTFCDATNWPLQTWPYMKNQSILVCPSDPQPHPAPGCGWDLSYTMNDAMTGAHSKSLARPAAEVLLFDGTRPFGQRGAADFRHNSGLNVGYADGHVKWVNQGNWSSQWGP